MGIVISYYVIDDKLIEKGKDETFDLIEYIEENILLQHEYNNQMFEKNGIQFGAFVKAWNPTFELLKILNKSENEYLKQILKTEKFGGIDERPYLINSENVKKVWQELKNISFGLIEKTLLDEKVLNQVKNIDGYRMKSIENKELILIEFIEIYNAFYTAQARNKGIAIDLY